MSVELEGRRIDVPSDEPSTPEPVPPPPRLPVYEAETGERVTVPLRAIAVGRSGDKGNDANIGLIARRAEFFPLLFAQMTEARVAAFFAHFLQGPVVRYALPGFHALNFHLHDVLGGGGTASLRYDPQAKSYAQMLLDVAVTVPAAWVNEEGPLSEWTGMSGGRGETA